MIFIKSILISSSVKCHKSFILLKRLKSGSKSKELSCRKKALEHFDNFYKAVFTRRWPSIRLGLLSRQKHMAVLNNFGDVEETEELLQTHGAFDLKTFLEFESQEWEKSWSDAFEKESEDAEVGELIGEQLEKEERRELSELYREGGELGSKVKFLSDDAKAGGTEKEEEPMFDPVEAKSSLHRDLKTPQIDKSRMIEPDDGVMLSSMSEYVPVTLLRGLEDYVPESEYYKYYQGRVDVPITVEKETQFDFPENLKVYTFDRGDITEFPESTRTIHDVDNFFEVDGAELLTVLALGVEPEDRVLDLFSTSGNMAYCIFQTLRPKTLVCVTNGSNKTENIFRKTLHDYSPFWRDMLVVSNTKLEKFRADELFDKVLIDVPSTEDKLSVFEEELNIFHPKNVRKRLGLPALQSDFLLRALQMVRPGGTVVYSTSTLSPIQNEGVVTSALKSVWDTYKMEFIVKDLSPALGHTSKIYRFANFLKMKYGTLVVPFVPSNFGPRINQGVQPVALEPDSALEETQTSPRAGKKL